MVGLPFAVTVHLLLYPNQEEERTEYPSVAGSNPVRSTKDYSKGATFFIESPLLWTDTHLY